MRSRHRRWRSWRAAAGCGKKGPPLAPLNMAPEAPQRRHGAPARRHGVSADDGAGEERRAAPGRISVDHLEVYAVTLAPGAAAPPNRDLLKPEYVDRDDPRRAAARSRGGGAATTPETRPRPGDDDHVRRDAHARGARRRRTVTKPRQARRRRDDAGARPRRRRRRRRAARRPPDGTARADAAVLPCRA